MHETSTLLGSADAPAPVHQTAPDPVYAPEARPLPPAPRELGWAWSLVLVLTVWAWGLSIL